MNESLQPFETQCEALAERLKLKEQWESQVQFLNEVGILELLPESQELGIVGIDGREYPVPEYSEIMQKITPEKAEILERKSEQGFNKMLLVPFAIPLERLIDRYERELVKQSENGGVINSNGEKIEINPKNPITFMDNEFKSSDLTKKLAYYPTHPDYGGETKSEIISKDSPWKFHFVEDLDHIPQQEEGQTIGGRKQLETGMSPRQYLLQVQRNAMYSNEQGMTPEDWLCNAILNLRNNGKQIDSAGRNGQTCYLIGSGYQYGPSGEEIASAGWGRIKSDSAFLGADFNSESQQNFGVRTVVEI